MAKRKGVTYTTMILTDGTRSLYGVFRVPTRSHKPKVLDMHSAEQIASVPWVHARVTVEDMRQWCYEQSKRHETPGWPAFEWNVYAEAPTS